jgi:hypothetical protein
MCHVASPVTSIVDCGRQPIDEAELRQSKSIRIKHTSRLTTVGRRRSRARGRSEKSHLLHRASSGRRDRISSTAPRPTRGEVTSRPPRLGLRAPFDRLRTGPSTGSGSGQAENQACDACLMWIPLPVAVTGSEVRLRGRVGRTMDLFDEQWPCRGACRDRLDVVEHFHAEQRAGINEAAGQLDVVSAWDRIAAGMVVRLMCPESLCAAIWKRAGIHGRSTRTASHNDKRSTPENRARTSETGDCQSRPVARHVSGVRKAEAVAMEPAG